MTERASYYSGSNAEMKWLVMREQRAAVGSGRLQGEAAAHL